MVLVIDDATEIHRDSYSRRNTRYHWTAEEVGGWEVGYERVQTDAIGPTPCIGYILATMNRPKLCRRSPYNGAYIRAIKKARDNQRLRKMKTKNERRKREVKKPPPTDRCIFSSNFVLIFLHWK